MKTLLIVESPNKVKTIKGYVGEDYYVSASVGHIRDLKKTELSVDVDNNFKESYEIITDTKNPGLDKHRVVEQLQGLAKKVDLIILATDPDREGEAISWHLEHELRKINKNIKRVKFNEITKPVILEALKSPEEINLDLVNAQRARRILDRLVGFLVSGLLQNKMDANLSAGRVQSAVLRLIKDRDDEIRNFVPKEYWNIFANLSKQQEDNIFKAKLVKKDDKNIEVTNREDCENILKELNGVNYIVDKIENKTEKRKPKAPLITSSLQKQSYNAFRYDSDTTMKVAQQLFEGIEIDGQERHGLITYMRTDSTSVSKDFQKETLEYIGQIYGDKYVPETPNLYKNKDNAQEAHECIRPTYLANEPDAIKKFLTKQQYDVYSLIYNKYLASQMAHAIFDTVTFHIKANNYLFTEKGSVMKFDGFLKHLNVKNTSDDTEDDKDGKDKLLPNVSEGEVLKLHKLDNEQKFTQPPSLFDNGTLIETLERLGIGRPSTFATILKTIIARGYVIVAQEKGQKKEYFQITDLGRRVVNDLIQYFSNLFNLDYTKKMEDLLDEIEHKKTDYLTVLKDFYKDFKAELDGAYSNMPVSKPVNYFDKPCPKCNHKLILKKGKFGEYVECETYPSCDFRSTKENMTVQESNITCPNCKEHKLVKKQNKEKKFFYICQSGSCPSLPFFEEKHVHKEPCDKCGKPMILGSNAKGKFYSCLGYFNKDAQCKNFRPYIDPKAEKCPNCGKPLVKRKGQYGDFWSCSGYPDCKYIKNDDKNKKSDNKPSSQKPAPQKSSEKCDKCGSDMNIRVNSTDKTKKFLACSKYPECKNTKPYNGK